ncbi:hypothetical protein EDD86DRAFT_210399 [Gorgonomyces haynaldii]|nr:hypothetical protein EDD86DRAFT_210399 [Gorgonomyces haynaldii]
MTKGLLEQWTKRLSSLTELILPTDYARPIPQRVVEAEYVLSVSDQTSMAILQLCMMWKQKYPELQACTPFQVILAAFSILLHKYTGEQDITVGSSSTAANPLVLRMNLSPSAPIVDVLRTVYQTELEAAQDEVPFADLVDHLTPEKDGESFRPSLFKVRFFNLTDTSPDTLQSSTTSSSCDLTIFVSQEPTLRRLLPIEIKVVYNSVLFAESRIKFMLDQLQYLLEAVAQDPFKPIGSVSLVTPSTKDILPNPTSDLHWDQFEGAITDIFTRNAEKFPDRRCVVESIDGQPERIFTYQQIHEASNIVANHLICSGIKREDVVVLYSYRGVDLVVAVMGTLKAGATFSVIDPAYPPPRQNIYLSVAKPKGLVILEKAGVLDPLVEQYIAEHLEIVCRIPGLRIEGDGLKGGLVNGQDIFSQKDTSNPNVTLGPDSIGTLSFTSGSTGIPKGVRGRHFSLTHFYPWMKQEFEMTEKERFTMLSGIAHDPIQRDIFTPLFLGAELHIPTSEDIGFPGRLAEWMAKQNITITHLTPAMGQLLSANAVAHIPTLRHAFFVGDVLTKRDVLRLQYLAPNVHVINMYGTTETQRAVSFLKIPPVSVHPGYLSEQKDIMPAGKGMKNVQLLVVNNAGLLAGVGEVGEIYVRSGGLAEGYLALPDVTKAKFLENPFRTGDYPKTRDLPYFHGPRDRMYRTGDLGRYRPDGSVECTGRADDQVKIRGFRIELGEIDTHLSQHPKIRENVTLVRRDKYEEQTLVSYFVPLDQLLNVGEFVQDVREYLKQKLPSYAIPTVFVPLVRMPLTPNGKVDKNALPFPDTALAVAKQESNDSFTSLQTALRDVWAQVLKTDKSTISLSSNFFEIGGHSVMATRLVFEMRKALAVEAPLGIVYRSPTLEKMAQEIEYLRGDMMTISAAQVSSEENIVAPKRTKSTEMLSVVDNLEDIFDYAADLEVVDDASLAANGRTLASVENPVFFVTGVTGFLGAFILDSIFKSVPKAQVYCLVRAQDSEKGLVRVLDNCKRHLIETPWKDQLVALAGDLAAPQFGIAEWTALTQKIDIIIHNGALVHWVYPYEKLRGSNVLGTKTALELATTGKLKSLHFVSSTSVLDTEHYVRKLGLGQSVLESDDLEGSRKGLRSGYGQTKWVAEKLVMNARSRGVPATIIRPGYIVGHSQSGVTNTDDFIWRLVKGCMQLGKVPKISNVVNMCCVDYVADCVVKVALSPASVSLGVFHTWNAFKFRFDDMFSALIDQGYELQNSEYIHWRTALMELTMATTDNALFPLLHFVLDDLPTSTKSPELDDSNARKILQPLGIQSRDMKQLMSLYLGYLTAVGFLEQPKKPLPQLSIWEQVKGQIVGRSGQ